MADGVRSPVTLMRLLTRLCWLGVVGLLVVGFAFLIVPYQTLSIVDHTTDKLPQVMGGRYLFFGFVLAAVLVLRDQRLLAGLLIGFAGVAFIDAGIYWGANAVPHGVVGVVCLIAAGALFWGKA